MICGAVFVLSAVGIELFGSAVTAAENHDSPLYEVLTTVEKLLEIAGVMAALYVLLSHLARVLGEDRRSTSDMPAA